jgi:hypothetical protein
VGLQTPENKALSRSIIRKSACVLTEITLRKSQDFLLFLQEAGRDPFRLTEKGNLRLGDIHYFGEHFQQDISHSTELRGGVGHLLIESRLM